MDQQEMQQKFGLTPRELEIVSLVVVGYTERETAEYLNLNEAAVTRHLENTFKKLGISTREELARFAVDHDLPLSDIPAKDEWTRSGRWPGWRPEGLAVTVMTDRKLPRELNDGALQALIAAEMHLDVLRRQAEANLPIGAAELGRIQSFLREEVMKLRKLIIALHS
jgi:DNA-binding CsgD family transcriptional regulator